MFSTIKRIFFAAESLRKQAYLQFTLALIGLPSSFFLPQRIQIVVIAALSWWAILISAQTFIAASEANKKAEKIEADKIETKTIETDEVKEY